MDELRLVGLDGESTVVIRAEPATPLRDVAAELQRVFSTDYVPIIAGVALTGMAPFGDVAAVEGTTIEWAPPDTVPDDIGLKVTCIDGANHGTSWPINRREMFIGREGCEITVADRAVSRRHTRLSVESKGVLIEDLGSTNGTELNGSRLEHAALLQPGDRLRVGTTTLEISSVAPTPVQSLSSTAYPDAHDSGRGVSSSGPRLCVIGGARSGTEYPIEQSQVIVGRGPGAHVSIDDPMLAPQHFRLGFDAGTITVEDSGTGGGTTLDGFDVTRTYALRAGSIIGAGEHLFAVRPAPIADAVLGRLSDGRRRYDRIARIRSSLPTPSVTIPSEPTPPEKPPFPWPIVIAPLLLAVVMAFVFQRPEALLFSLLSPVMAVSSNMSYRRSAGRRAEQAQATFDAEMSAALERINNLVFEQAAELRQRIPDACVIADTALGPGARLWERRPNDDDTMCVRIGTGTAPADIRISGSTDAPAPVMTDAPITVDLEAAGVTSIAGSHDQTHALARWMLAQLVTMVSPADLKIGLLTHADTSADWGWLAWTPHARLAGGDGVFVGNDQHTIETRVSALTSRLDERQAQRNEQRIDVFAPLVLTVIDDAREFRRVPGVIRLLEEGPSVGLLFLTIDSETNRTPGEANALVAFEHHGSSHCRLDVTGDQPRFHVLYEGVSADWLTALARSMSAIEPATEDAASAIPGLVRYADLVDLDVEDDAALLTSWAAGAITCRAVIGATSEGPFSVDIARDGPHAFIAGTTGSGKTELLLTFITALALGNRPEAMNIIIVDWKGGGDFVELGGLPHTVGMVTNLDGHLAKRALASLQAEVGRRQGVLKLLKEQDAISESNLASLWDEQPELGRQHGMGRLVIVVDEFAELATSLPEFLAGLIRIARVGRALGIHLVLATQRPRGVISGDLAANVGLRMVLRTESGESREVLESDHADTISRNTRGRGFVRYGDPPRLVEFQTARVAGRRPGSVAGLRPPIVDVVGWREIGYALSTPPQVDQGPAPEATDLRALVDMTRRVSNAMGLHPPPSPWLPPLPPHVGLDQLAAPPGSLAAPFGLIDEPSEQRQQPIVFDLAHDGHLAFAGSAGSGRTTALRTLAASIATHISPADCNMYGFDFGNGGLLALADLPHVGAVVRSNEADRLARVLERLNAEVGSRQHALAAAQAANIGDQRVLDPANALAHIVILVDRWDSFVAQYPLDTEEHQIVLRLLRDGLGVGIHLVMTGDRGLLGGRMAGEFERKLMLPFADRDDYRDGRLRPQDLPEVIAPGRAFVADSGAEVQIASIGDDDSGPALRRSIGEIATRAAPTDDVRATFELIRVEALPTSIALSEVWKQINPARIASPLSGLIGVGGDDLSPEIVDFADVGPGFTIAGPPGSGRSTALMALARSALSFGARVVAITPRNSPLSGLDAVGFAVVDVADLDATALKAQIDQAPTLLLVDDVHLLSADDAMLLRSVVDAYPTGGVFGFAIAGDIDKLSLLPLAMAARRSGSGLLLSPRNLDRDLLSLSGLPSTIVGRQPPGRGFLARRSTGHEIQVVA